MYLQKWTLFAYQNILFIFPLVRELAASHAPLRERETDSQRHRDRHRQKDRDIERHRHTDREVRESALQIAVALTLQLQTLGYLMRSTQTDDRW